MTLKHTISSHGQSQGWGLLAPCESSCTRTRDTETCHLGWRGQPIGLQLFHYRTLGLGMVGGLGDDLLKYLWEDLRIGLACAGQLRRDGNSKRVTRPIWPSTRISPAMRFTQQLRGGKKQGWTHQKKEDFDLPTRGKLQSHQQKTFDILLANSNKEI